MSSFKLLIMLLLFSVRLTVTKNYTPTELFDYAEDNIFTVAYLPELHSSLEGLGKKLSKETLECAKKAIDTSLQKLDQSIISSLCRIEEAHKEVMSLCSNAEIGWWERIKTLPKDQWLDKYGLEIPEQELFQKCDAALQRLHEQKKHDFDLRLARNACEKLRSELYKLEKKYNSKRQSTCCAESK